MHFSSAFFCSLNISESLSVGLSMAAAGEDCCYISVGAATTIGGRF